MKIPRIYVAFIILAGLGLVGGLLLASRHPAAAGSNQCGSNGQLYHVVIQYDRVSPENTDARLCDKLEFTNKDNVAREIAFGPHEHHVPYDGVAARILGYNQSFTITLNEAGLYHFHDHIHDEVSGFFSVSK